MAEENKIVFIKLKWGTREKLKTLGIKGETYDTIIQRLIEVEEERR
jgi:hypothetical protein